MTATLLPAPPDIEQLEKIVGPMPAPAPENPVLKVKALLSKNGWAKGQWVSPTGSMCVGQAILFVIHGSLIGSEDSRGDLHRNPIAKTVLRAINSTGLNWGQYSSIPNFNDSPGIGYQHIDRVLNEAARIWDQEHPVK
jgi:hypothetical protein